MKNFLAIKSILLLIVLITSAASCTKGSGSGGRASIKGKIFAKNLMANLSVVADSGFLGEHNVYLSYGDNLSVAEKVETSHTGDFEFLYLRPGKYTVYTYSKQPFAIGQLDSAVVKSIEITEKAQVADLGIIRIYSDKN